MIGSFELAEQDIENKLESVKDLIPEMNRQKNLIKNLIDENKKLIAILKTKQNEYEYNEIRFNSN